MNIEWLLIIAMVGAYIWHKRKPKPIPNRYYVDERPACVVVRLKVSSMASIFPDVDPRRADVIAYWEGEVTKGQGKSVDWYSGAEWKVGKAHELCNLLNKGG